MDGTALISIPIRDQSQIAEGGRWALHVVSRAKFY
jgi:hypothetical protein